MDYLNCSQATHIFVTGNCLHGIKIQVSLIINLTFKLNKPFSATWSSVSNPDPPICIFT